VKLKSFITILASLLLISNAFGQDTPKNDKKVKKDKWKYVGSAVVDVRLGINVESYFNENKVEKNEQSVKFQIKEQPDKPIAFFKKIFARLYEFNPDRYAGFTHLITFFEGNCLERTLKVKQQEVWGTKNKEEPIITFKVEREPERVRPGSSKESDLLKACRK
jgi:hypothetical protein